LEALRRETDQVNSLLAGVFTEEESPNILQTEAVSPNVPTEVPLGEVLLPGLDTKHQKFLIEVLRQASWERKELLAMAAQSQIMLDGALEQINDAAFELIGEPITEGDDPIYVQQNILEAAE